MFLMVDKQAFSEWLQKKMGDITQSELSRRSGLHRAIISKVINQISEPTPTTIEALARGLGLPREELFRAAGILPPIPETRSKIEELSHLANLLENDDDIQDLIEIAKMRLKRKEENKIHKQKSSRSMRPARTA